MDKEYRLSLERALSYDRSIISDFYQQAEPRWSYYRLECLQLLSEAYRSLINGCPRASTIVAGEALFRAVCDRILFLRPTHGNVRYRSSSRALSDLDDDEILYDLVDEFSFDEALGILRRCNTYSQELIDCMYDVKWLRNQAAHKNMPIVLDWDEADGEPSDSEFEVMLDAMADGTFAFPEAYKIWNNTREHSRWIFFDCRKYDCTLKHLDNPDRIAAIQSWLVVDIIRNVSTGELNTSTDNRLSPSGSLIEAVEAFLRAQRDDAQDR